MIETFVKTEFDGYFVSDKGRVKSTRNREPKILKCSFDNHGYKKFIVFVDGKFKNIKVHRIVYATFNGLRMSDIPKNLMIDHIDGDKSNNCLNNLELVTRKENVRRAWEEQGLMDWHKRAVNQYSIDGKYIRTFETITSAAAAIKSHENIDSVKTGIQRACAANCKNAFSCKGYIWRYSDEYNPGEDIKPSGKEKVCGKKVIQFSKNEKPIKIWNSVKEACEAMKIKNQSSLRNCLCGLSKTAYGYIWKWSA